MLSHKKREVQRYALSALLPVWYASFLVDNPQFSKLEQQLLLAGFPKKYGGFDVAFVAFHVDDFAKSKPFMLNFHAGL